MVCSRLLQKLLGDPDFCQSHFCLRNQDTGHWWAGHIAHVDELAAYHEVYEVLRH